MGNYSLAHCSKRWHTTANRLKRWLRLAGSECQIITVDGLKIKLCAWPASWWRVIPLFGQWRMFQLGHHLAFDVEATVIEAVGRRELTLRLTIDVSGQPLHTDVLDYSFSGQVGQKVKRKTDPFFLHPTGDAVLRGIAPGPFRDDLYSFSIEETANKAAALVAAIFIALVGGGVGALGTWFLTNGG